MIPGMSFNSLVFAASFTTLLFCLFLARWILKQPEGSVEMKTISRAIAEGARGYLRQQYASVAVFFAVVFVVLFAMFLKGLLVIFVPIAFVSGGAFSGFCGWLGMAIATKTNARTAQAARKSLGRALRVAYSGGTVIAFTVVGLGLLEIATWFMILKWYYTRVEPLPEDVFFTAITSTMLCFGLGASSYALFARLGGGIYTKAADVGADLVGKLEAGIPEDDPRNPAVIADQVGDTVGDVVGMGADLYESYVDSILATMALAAAAGLRLPGIITPLLVAVCGAVASLIGFFFVKTADDAVPRELLRALHRGIWAAVILAMVFSFFVIRYVLEANFGVFWSVVIGLLAGVFIGRFSEFFTSSAHAPTQSLVRASHIGPAAVIIKGIALGMLSPAGPVLVVGGAILASFAVSGGFGNFSMGLYGVGISSVGMLSLLGIIFSADAFGPIADNAGGVAEMAKLEPEARKRTEQLDALGSLTAATARGFAIGSAVLTALVLIVAYQHHVLYESTRLGIALEMDASLFNPSVIISLFIGAMMPFVFCGLSLHAVGRTAGAIVEEVRRQFNDLQGLLEGKVRADYSQCVSLATRAAQRQMILPSLLAIIVPVVTGLFLGVEATVGLLMGALATGFVLAVMMVNTGATLENARKYIEEGHCGGKGSEIHKAAVCGDSVGDPFKDTAGPTLSLLIKLMCMVSIVFSGVVITSSFIK